MTKLQSVLLDFPIVLETILTQAFLRRLQHAGGLEIPVKIILQNFQKQLI